MKKYIYIAKGFLLERMVYRFSLFFNALEKYIYILLIFFLWKAIYRSLGQENLSMNFESTFTYLSLATAIFGLFQTWVDMGRLGDISPYDKWRSLHNFDKALRFSNLYVFQENNMGHSEFTNYNSASFSSLKVYS